MEKIALEIAKRFINERREFFSEIEKNILKLAKIVKNTLPDARIFVFGSYAKEKHNIYLSDVDILIVSREIINKPMFYRAEIISRIRKKINFSYIFQIHLITPEEFEIYKRFIDVMKEVKT